MAEEISKTVRLKLSKDEWLRLRILAAERDIKLTDMLSVLVRKHLLAPKRPATQT